MGKGVINALAARVRILEKQLQKIIEESVQKQVQVTEDGSDRCEGHEGE